VIDFGRLAADFGVDCLQLFVKRLQFLLGRFQFFVGGLVPSLADFSSSFELSSSSNIACIDGFSQVSAFVCRHCGQGVAL